MELETVESVLKDWNNGLTHGEILDKHNIPKEYEFAITVGGIGLTAEEIVIKLMNVRSDMREKEILNVMRANYN